MAAPDERTPLARYDTAPLQTLTVGSQPVYSLLDILSNFENEYIMVTLINYLIEHGHTVAYGVSTINPTSMSRENRLLFVGHINRHVAR